MSSLTVIFTVFVLSSLLLLASSSPSANSRNQRTISLCEEVPNCPPLSCENPVGMRDCCPVCEEDANDCDHNGMMIEHGQTFHPTLHATDSPMNSSASAASDCSTCSCINGDVDCRNECPELQCDTGDVVISKASCCPICSSCKDLDGRNFSIGESWHPSLHPYGIITCMNCTCMDYVAICVKLPCPDVVLPLCPPGNPVVDIILCCPECTLVPPIPGPTPNTSITTSANNINGTISPIMIKTCPNPYTVRIWTHKEEDAMVFEYTTKQVDNVDIWRWTSVNDSYIRTTEKLGSMSSHVVADYNFIGWCKARRVNGLGFREKKKEKLENCISNCADLVTKLVRTITICEDTSD